LYDVVLVTAATECSIGQCRTSVTDDSICKHAHISTFVIFCIYFKANEPAKQLRTVK